MIQRLAQFLRAIDLINEWIGRFAAWLILALIGVVSWEVVCRYAFGAPTVWAFETSCFLYGSCFMLGMGYTLLHKKHVVIETFSSHLSPRTQAILICLCYVVFFFIFVPPLIVLGTKLAVKSCAMHEHSYSPWAPPLCYIKTIIPISFFILLIQGIAEFTRKLVFALKGIQL